MQTQYRINRFAPHVGERLFAFSVEYAERGWFGRTKWVWVQTFYSFTEALDFVTKELKDTAGWPKYYGGWPCR